jgi:transcription-repair coupling factor (superfamily II helicase)
LRRINVVIDLNVEAYLPNDFFTSELDKLNFYREIESISNLEDLENLMISFEELNEDFKKSSYNLFCLIRLKILASNYKIKSIKRV